MRRLLKILLVVSSLQFIAGCASTLQLRAVKPSNTASEEKLTVYVTNPELSREYEILKRSKIYLISEDREIRTSITLHPIKRQFSCGNPLILSGITLGLIPGYLPAGTEFEYELTDSGKTETYSHFLLMYERFSIWEHFVKSDEIEVMSQALRSSKREPSNWAQQATEGDTAPDLKIK